MNPSTQDIWIPTPAGRLFARLWSAAKPQANADTPIVLLHDSLGCIELWRDFPALLAQASGRTVIAYDRLGFGRSDAHPGLLPQSFIRDEAGASFAAVCDALGLDRFVLFGHSVGGGMAVACAARWVQRCRALITESAQAFVEGRTLQGIRDAQQSFAQDPQLLRLRKYHGDKAPWVLSAWIDTWQAPGFASWNLDEDLRRVTCPVLVLHGVLDEYGSVLHPQRIAELVAGPSRSVVLDGCGHVPHREMTDVVLATVTGWLAAV